MFGCVVIPPLRQKSICVRTQIAKTGYLPAEYITPTFLTRTPSPFCAGWRWGLLSRKIFFDFIFFVSYSISTRILIFLFFFDSRLDSCFDSVFQIILFNYFDSIKVRHLKLDSIFRNIHRFDSLQVLLDIYSFAILIFASEFLLASISTCFSIVDSML